MSVRAVNGRKPRDVGARAGIGQARLGGRLAVLVVLAVVGCAVSLYLAAFQLGLVHGIWDPLFGGGSREVLTSFIARLLPIPDALLGAGVYAVDVVLALALAARAWHPETVALGLAVVATAGAVVGIGLAIVQALVVGTFCTLCLTSTAISIALAIGAVGEARAIHRSPQEVRP